MALIFSYRLYGLTVASEIELPELEPASPGGPDLAIRRGVVPNDVPVQVPGVARFDVRGGSEIIVEVADGAELRNVRLYLLGSALGLLLHQRGMLPLHANALAIDGTAVAVMGAPGAGKSTLAGLLLGRGARLIGDDVCAVQVDGARATVHPGLPRLRLWGESITVVGRRDDPRTRAYAGADDWDKWDVPIRADEFATGALPLSAIYLLTDAAELNVSGMAGAAAVEALSANTYRGDYLQGSEAVATHWRACVQLAAAIPIFRLERPRDLTRLDALGEMLLAHQRSAAAARTGAAVP